MRSATRGQWAILYIVASFLGCSSPAPGNHQPFYFVQHMDGAEAVFDAIQFRSVRKDGLLYSPITMSDETQLSMTPPLPSKLTFTVHVPRDPELRFSIGATRIGEASLPAPVVFRLHIDAGDTPELCFSETIARSRAQVWNYRRVDLSRWSGKDVRLTFETRLGERQRVPSSQPFSTMQLPVLASWGNPVLTSVSAPTDEPHLILISLDCLRFDHMGLYGYSRDTTPRIDQFARDAMVFENAVSASSWTLPTHMSMLTGLPPSFHGASKWRRLDDSVPYLPEWLAQSGYQTVGIASWVYVSQAFGFERGFHVYRVLDQPRAEVVVDEALKVLRDSKGQKLFLFLHFFDPHWRYLPPRDFIDRFGARPDDVSGLLAMVADGLPPPSSKEIHQVIDLYDAEIAYMDGEIGRFLEALEEMGMYDSSLIIVTADHGESFYEHGHWEHTQTLYDELTRIPLIVKWPNSTPKGSYKQPVGQVDIFPTLLEGAGIEPPSAGLKHLGRGSGEGNRNQITSEVTWIAPEATTMKVSLRSDQTKYIATLVGPTGDPLAARDITHEELYDLLADPSENNNVAADLQFETRLGLFRRDLRDFLEEARKLRSERQGREILLEEDVLRKLESLGYTMDSGKR